MAKSRLLPVYVGKVCATLRSLARPLARWPAARTGEWEAARRNLRTILDAVPSMIGYWDRDQRNRFANRAYCEWFGLDPDAVAGRSMQALLGAPLYGLNTPHIAAVLQGEAQMFERVAVGRDGVSRHYLTKYLPDISDGAVHGFYSLVNDISEMVASRQALASVLRENDVLVRTINEQMLYSVTDAEGIILEVNDNFCAAYGYGRRELIGLHHRLLSSGQHDRVFWADMRQTVMAGGTWNGTVCNQAVDGTAKWFDTVVAPYFDAHGVIERYVALHTDVTARHAADAALRESTLRAEQASIAKSQFVANMSHEIRTPMNAMLGMLELTLRTDLNARQRDYVDKARRAGATLLALLNDVLDFSKIDAGKLELDEQAFEVDVLLRDLAAVLSGNHINQQVEVVFDIAPAIPAWLRGDAQRIGQVLVNLAGNALKFTQVGDVVVELAVLDTQPDALTVRASVSDTGIGIPASQLGMIFDGFTQAEASTARRFGGTGLGLAISARIVALMGGTLQVSSEVGRGSRFWFDIRLGTVPDTASTQAGRGARRTRYALTVEDNAAPATATATATVLLPQRQQRLAGLRLLVVEDNFLNRQVAFELLGGEGALVDLAEGGQQGVDLATDPARAYDAIIMDVQMPDVDGLEATRRIRAMPGGAQLPIMAMTANVSIADRDACLAAGMNTHVGKPFDIDQVVAQVRALVELAAVAQGELIDLAGALPRFLDDAGVYARFLGNYERESGTLLARLEREQADGDARAAAATLHALKGMALTMGAPRLAHVLAAPAGSLHHHAALRALTDTSILAARAGLAQLAPPQ